MRVVSSKSVHLKMTKEEVYQELTAEKKWYLPHLKQQAASAFQTRFEAGTATEETIKKIFALYGYKVESPTQFVKL